MQFWPPDDEHMYSKHVEARNKLIVKQNSCASSWLITEINILTCTDSKTSKVTSSWFFILQIFSNPCTYSPWWWVSKARNMFALCILTIFVVINKCMYLFVTLWQKKRKLSTLFVPRLTLTSSGLIWLVSPPFRRKSRTRSFKVATPNYTN